MGAHQTADTGGSWDAIGGMTSNSRASHIDGRSRAQQSLTIVIQLFRQVVESPLKLRLSVSHAGHSAVLRLDGFDMCQFNSSRLRFTTLSSHVTRVPRRASNRRMLAVNSN